METRRTRGKRFKYDIDEYQPDIGDASDSNDLENLEDLRKSKIRDSNREYAKRMTILHTWADYWSDYTTREGDAYPKDEALSIIKKSKKITCPIESCSKAYSTYAGLKYHYARCNIERCFKCKVCNPPTDNKTKGDLLRHMIRNHYKDLPDLDAEQKEIANTYLLGSGRNDKTKRRNNLSDYESQMNCRHIVKLYFDMIDKAFNSPTQRPFKDWHTLSRDWEYLSYGSDKRRYLPPEVESPSIKTSSTSWFKLKAGESVIIPCGNTNNMSTPDDHNSQMDANLLFYTGGVCTSAAWLPRPFAKDDSCQELVAISVKSCSMDKDIYYKDCKDLDGCIQFWEMQIPIVNSQVADRQEHSTKPGLSFMIGHGWGNIFEMSWCPLGASWEPLDRTQSRDDAVLSRVGILALACGDGHIRLISVPHPEHMSSPPADAVKVEELIEAVPVYRVRPIALLAPPGCGQSTDHQTPACTSVYWNLEDNQQLMVAGYSSGCVALFDLSNFSPILYSSIEHYHVYRPFRTWFAHGLPVAGVAMLSSQADRFFVATGARDRLLKIWNPMDLNTCLTSDRAPVTRVVWDYRMRGVVSSTEAAFTSFQNRVSYRYPMRDGSFNSTTIATHRATVWGLTNSIITSALATSDEAGEVMIATYGRPIQKKDRNMLFTHSIFTIMPRAIRPQQVSELTQNCPFYSQNSLFSDNDPRMTEEITTTNDNNELITIMQPATATNEMIGDNSLELELDENNVEDVYGLAERQMANKPTNWLLPIDHPAVETYQDFKRNFGLEFVEYDQTYPQKDHQLPESCLRANDISKIYCDRVCDYQFSSVKHVAFSPNHGSFSHLLSVSHIGLCRVDKIKIVDHIYRPHIETLNSQRRS